MGAQLLAALSGQGQKISGGLLIKGSVTLLIIFCYLIIIMNVRPITGSGDALRTCWAHETQMPVPEAALEYAGFRQADAAFFDVERAFGSFPVFADGTPRHFLRAEELLAYRTHWIN